MLKFDVIFLHINQPSDRAVASRDPYFFFVYIPKQLQRASNLVSTSKLDLLFNCLVCNLNRIHDTGHLKFLPRLSFVDLN